MHDTEWFKGIDMSADGRGQIGHVGAHALRRRGFHPLHDRGQVLVDLAVAITLDGACGCS